MPSGVSRSVLLMLLSVILFASNTLLVRAVAIHAPQADGWLAAFLRCDGAQSALRYLKSRKVSDFKAPSASSYNKTT